MRRYNDIGTDAKTDENCSGSVDATTDQHHAMSDPSENAPKRKWAGIVAINIILLLTAGLLILDHLTRSGQLAALMANFKTTPEPTPIDEGVDIDAVKLFFDTAEYNETLMDVDIVDAKITLHYALDATLTSKQVDAFAMKQANKAEQIKGWKYQPSTTHVEIFIYDPPQPDNDDEWTYSQTYVPFDVYHGMQMEDRSDVVRKHRTAQRISSEDITP